MAQAGAADSADYNQKVQALLADLVEHEELRCNLLRTQAALMADAPDQD